MIEEVPATIEQVDVAWLRRLLDEGSVADLRVNRVGEGFGLAARIYRVDVFSDKPLPALAVKLCDAETALAEKHVYEIVLSRTRVPRPRLIAVGAAGDRGVVVYEFIHGRQGDALAGCPDATVGRVVVVLADLHAGWWGDTGRAGVPALADQARRELGADQVERCLERHGGGLDSPAIELIRSLPERIDRAATELLEHPLTVVHADAHLDNVLILADDGPVVLDWSSARIGPAGVDLARWYVEGMTASQRIHMWPGLLATYLGELHAHGVEGYTINDLERAVFLAQLVMIPAIVRWGAGDLPSQQPARATALLRAELRATTDMVLGR